MSLNLCVNVCKLMRECQQIYSRMPVNFSENVSKCMRECQYIYA